MFNYDFIKSSSKSNPHSPSTFLGTTQLSKSPQHSTHDKGLLNPLFHRNIKVFKRNFQSRLKVDIHSISSTTFKPIILHKQIIPMKKPRYPNHVYNVLTNQINYLSETTLHKSDLKPNTNLINKDTPNCPKYCRRNILQKYKNYRYLNASALEKLSSKTLDFGFLKFNPRIHVKDISTEKRKEQEFFSRKSNKHKPFISRSYTKTSTLIAKEKMDIKKSIEKLQQAKEVLENMNKTKEQQPTNITPKTEDKTRSLHAIKLGNNSLNVSEKNYASMRQTSLMNRLILKLMDNDELIEKSVMNVNKPFDRYSKFKRVCKREKIRVDNLVHDLNKANSVNEDLMRVYINSIKKVKQTYKQNITIFDDIIVKADHKNNNNR